MQLPLPWGSGSRASKGSPRPRSRPPAVLQVGADTYPLAIVRHRRARRYVLRVTAEGGLRLTVPRGASISGGLAFARTQADWIAGERVKRAASRRAWETGTLIWFRGAQVPLVVSSSSVAFADQIAVRASASSVIRESVERHLQDVATLELPPRCLEMAAQHRLTVERVAVRNQRSRWGSCSSRGTIALNWRLIQMPVEVSEYVLLHELMHLKQPNHSRQFWREVAAVCDHWREAERWLSTHGRELL